MEDIEKMRDSFREAADILDEFINLKEKEKEGVDITNECESILGRFTLKMMAIQGFVSKM